MSVPALAFAGIRKSFGRREVLRGLDLEVGEGESFALVGMNGAGKTTTIKGLLDFCALDGGGIRIFGESATENRARSRVAFLPERFLPPYYLSGREFLRYMLRLHGRRFDAARVARECEAVDLAAEALDRSSREYSKGMAQKVGLVSTFLSDKDLLILDEPMSGLDPKARLLVKERIGGLREAGRTLFFSTHMLSDVEALCDRFAILHEGTVRFVGSPGECLERFGGDTLERAYLACITAGATS